MANNQKLKDNYQESIKPFQPKPSYVANCLKAFLVGGIICTLGQAIQNFYIAFFDFNEKMQVILPLQPLF